MQNKLTAQGFLQKFPCFAIPEGIVKRWMYKNKPVYINKKWCGYLVIDSQKYVTVSDSSTTICQRPDGI